MPREWVIDEYTGYQGLRLQDCSAVDPVYPMEQYTEAWRYLEKPRTNHGKVVVTTGTNDE